MWYSNDKFYKEYNSIILLLSQAKSTVTFSTDFVTFSTSDFVTFAVRVLLLALAVIYLVQKLLQGTFSVY